MRCAKFSGGSKYDPPPPSSDQTFYNSVRGLAVTSGGLNPPPPGKSTAVYKTFSLYGRSQFRSKLDYSSENKAFMCI